MADYVYVGRRRKPGWFLLWQLLTLGVYGRVWLYKTLRDLDGHSALFLDRRVYLPLLILPFVGPFLVKRRVAILVHGLLRHDVTSPSLPLRGTILLGLVPWVPLLHMRLQRVLNHHWKMHTKDEELALKQVELERARKRARTPEAQDELRVLEADVLRRQKELDDLRSAAIALREAEAVRRRAEAEIPTRARVGTVKKFLSVARSRVRIPRRSASPDEEEGASPAPEPPEEESASPLDPAVEPAEAPAEEEAAPSEPARRSLLRFLPKLPRRDPGAREAKKAARKAEKERRQLEKAAKKADAKEAGRKEPASRKSKATGEPKPKARSKR